MLRAAEVVTKLTAAGFGEWEKAKFAPEASQCNRVVNVELDVLLFLRFCNKDATRWRPSLLGWRPLLLVARSY